MIVPLPIFGLVLLVVLLSVLFTYTNGFQDGSSVAAGAIASRALGKMQAIALVALFEFLGAMFGGSAVANAIQSITNYPSEPSLLPVLAAALFAAIVWNYMTKILKVPSSSTHALVGGIVGAVIASTGNTKYLVWGSVGHLIHPTGLWKVIISLFASPAIGFAAGYFCFCALLLLLSRASNRVNKKLKIAQLFTTAALAFGHGANDTQKAMGLLLLTMNSAGIMHSQEIPVWIRLICGLAMVVGIISLAPGIVRRVGGIYRLRPIHGLSTELSSATVVIIGSLTGGPVSASQIIASTVMGVGSAERRKSVHWLIARDMLVAWFMTIPCAAILAAVLYTTLFHMLNNLIGPSILAK